MTAEMTLIVSLIISMTRMVPLIFPFIKAKDER